MAGLARHHRRIILFRTEFTPEPCDIDKTQILSVIGNPADIPDFVRPDYEEPTHLNEHGFSLQIYIGGPGGTPYEFTWFLKHRSVRFSSRMGERGQMSCSIYDFFKDDERLPFEPEAEQYAVLSNYPERNLVYFAGFLRGKNNVMITQREDGTEMREIALTFTDLFNELELEKTIIAQYENVTTAYILVDLLAKYTTLDVSEIDINLGLTVDAFQVKSESCAQVLQRIIDREDWTYWIDPGTRKIYVGPKASLAQSTGISVNESNVYDYFSRELDLNRNLNTYKNRIVYHYTEKLSYGTCNTTNGVNIVNSADVNNNWERITAPAYFALDGENAVYTIEENSTSGATREFRLSSPFMGTNTGAGYTIWGMRKKVVVQDAVGIAQMKRLRGGSGVIDDVIAGENENLFTREQAREVAALLLALSRPLNEGGDNTNNRKLPLNALFAGQTIYFNLPISKRFSGTVEIQSVETQETGAVFTDADGIQYPIVDYQLDFTHAQMRLQSQLRKLMMDSRRVTIADDDELEINLIVDEVVGVKSCLSVRRGYAIESAEVSVRDAVFLTEATKQAARSDVTPTYYPGVGRAPMTVGGV